MSMAGTWRSNDGSMMVVDRSEPSYSFQFSIMGVALSQGQIHRQGRGTYLANGVGVNGPAAIEFHLVERDVLEGRNQNLLDGGMMDQMLRNMGMGAMFQQLQPAIRMQRERRIRYLSGIWGEAGSNPERLIVQVMSQ
jgi:hypothetical protein